MNALRLCFGTLTILPVRPPGELDRRTGGWAMVLAPLAALALTVPAYALIRLLHWQQSAYVYALGAVGARVETPSRLPALLVAGLLVGLVAVLTRAMHLDGLADTADGLGSGKPAEQALGIMRKSDIGPFGVVTLVLVLLVQVAALQQLLSRGLGLPAVAAALVVSRLMLPVACSRGIRGARSDGLGALVAGSVGRVQLLLSAGLATACLLVAFVAALPLRQPTLVAQGALTVVTYRHGPVPASLVPPVVGSVVWPVLLLLGALLVGGLLLWRCVRRFGGITGDVLGACVEATFTAALVLLCLA
ncbi:MAG: adenosylcobinamide-GDP ribazoletransferase [Nocardioidaceae bacterium]